MRGSSFKVGLAHLMVLYLVWGSTYLAIRIAVGPGGGFGPFWLGATRVGLAGLLLLSYSRLQGIPLTLSRSEYVWLALSGLLLWTGGNGLISLGEERFASGYAAVINATSPLWIALLEAILNRRLPPWLQIVGIFLGFWGVALLSLTQPLSHLPWPLLLAPLLWSSGMLLTQRRPVRAPSVVAAGYQQLFGGLGFSLLAWVSRESWPHPSLQAWLAWSYLVIFGALAFTSFVLALRLLPASLVSTYAYVNPVVAVILGWAILHESVTPSLAVGAALILLSLALVFRARWANAGSGATR